MTALPPTVLALAPHVLIEFVHVPQGLFIMGQGRSAHPVSTGPYLMAKYPITVAQYRVYAEATGIAARNRSLRDDDDHPVRWVSWDDALAFCQWVSIVTGRGVRLPSEAEWEKAARGVDARRFPWGNRPPNRDLCNSGVWPITTTPVGKYSPQGDSPYGCADMAGNVWEWTSSQFAPYPYDATDGREDLEDRDRRHVMRGGSWGCMGRHVRASYRNTPLYDYRGSRYTGFRVCLSVGSEG